jgi:murein L,D-transpeptidase YafK
MYSELPEKPPAVSKYVLSMCRLSGRFCLAAKCIFLVSFIFLMLLPTLAPGQTTFAQEQNNYPRVRQARINREDTLDSLFNSSHIEYPPSKIMIVAYKQERQLELWAKPETLDVFSRLVTYPFTAFCGDLGP